MNIPTFATMSILYGPAFLVLFALVIMATLLICRALVRGLDKSGTLAPLPVPEQPNPYRIAYLRGGRNEVVRVLLFDLIQRGYLTAFDEKSWFFSTKRKLVQNPNHPDFHRLSKVERQVLQQLSSPQSAGDVFRLTSIPEVVQDWCDETDREFCDEQLIVSPEIWERSSTIRRNSGTVIVTLGGFKLVTALLFGHTNVAFLIIMAVFAIVVLPAVATPSRLTARGRQYLFVLQESYERLKEPDSLESWADADGLLMLAVGLFGVSVLRATPYGYFLEMFQQSAGGGVCCAMGGCGGGGWGGGGVGGCGGCGGGGGG